MAYDIFIYNLKPENKTVKDLNDDIKIIRDTDDEAILSKYLRTDGKLKLFFDTIAELYPDTNKIWEEPGIVHADSCIEMYVSHDNTDESIVKFIKEIYGIATAIGVVVYIPSMGGLLLEEKHLKFLQNPPVDFKQE
jgi:hypothetical protein